MANERFNALFCVLVVMAFAVVKTARGQRCFYIFGDSNFDFGNNNDLNTSYKANYLPYGIDFASVPSGRFSNGRTIPDFLGDLLNFNETIPPYKKSFKKSDVGINYASGGAGIFNETSYHLGDIISFEKQILNHAEMIERVHLSYEERQGCLYIINIGSNDYFMPNLYGANRIFSYDQYANLLIARYRNALKTLYGLAARKIVVFEVSKIGCTPRMIASHGGGKGCATKVNDAVNIFNKKLRNLVLKFDPKYDMKLTFVNLFFVVNSPLSAAAGFTVRDKSCCSVETGQELCARNKTICAAPSKYLYWDNFHYIEAANRMLARAAYGGLNTFPYSIAALWLL